ncbi:MAG: thioredoxin domain-containing protein [Candidatus Anstonellaceae archaeon]
MADKGSDALEKGEYVIGIAVILAALLVSATVYVSVNGLSDAISKLKLSAPAATGGTGGGGTGNGGTVAPPAPAGDWSFVSSDPAIGPKDAKVTVVEFADFQCPFCGIVFGRDLGGAQYAPIRGTSKKIIEEYAKTNKIRFVFHPMAFLGQESVDAANAAFCAREIAGDEGFFKMHDKIFQEQGDENAGVYSKANLKKFGAEIGFSTKAFTDCVDSGKYNGQVSTSNSQANAVGVRGTPTFAVNNQMSTPEYTGLKAQIDALLAK